MMIRKNLLQYFLLQLTNILFSAITNAQEYDGRPSDAVVGGCGVTKGCYRVPDKCQPADCSYFLSWQVRDSSIAFEFITKISKDNLWTGFAINDRKKMSGGSVVDCIVISSENNRVQIQMSHNEGKHNEVLDNLYLGLVSGSLSGQYTGSHIQCNFSRLKVVDPSVKEHKKVRNFNRPYYVQLGQGPTYSDGRKKRHRHKPHVSGQELTFLDHANYGASRSPFIIAHASLMIIAWMVFASLAVFSARYLKPQWSRKTIFGQPVWFQIHRVGVISTVCLVFISMVLIFYASQWQILAPSIHPLLGAITTGLLVINPLVASFRPAIIEGSRRTVLNVFTVR